MAGELTIEKNADGTAIINFPGGGSHKVTPDGANPDAVKALQDAYGDRIGSVIDAPNNSGTSVDSQGQNQTIPPKPVAEDYDGTWSMPENRQEIRLWHGSEH